MSKGYEAYLDDLLVPIARYCMKKGIRIQQLTEAAKLTLIKAAEEDIKNMSQEPNVSKIAIATGLHRRDVMRLWRDEEPPKIEENIHTKIIGLWQQDKRFKDKKGKPKLLSYKGKESDFIKLVSSVTNDLNPYTILFDLERSGMVEKTTTGLKLLKQVYKPSGNKEAGMKFLKDDIETLISAVDENIHEINKTPNLHIRTEYDNIPVEHIVELREWILDEGEKFHSQLREHISSYDRDINPSIKGTGRAKISVGAVSYISKKDEES